jgi:hypothetical protein
MTAICVSKAALISSFGAICQWSVGPTKTASPLKLLKAAPS